MTPTSIGDSVFGRSHLKMLRLVTDEMSGADLCGFRETARTLARLGLRRREILHELAMVLGHHVRSADSLRSVGIADPSDVANRLRWLPPTIAASEFATDDLLGRAVEAAEHERVEWLVSQHAEYLAATTDDDADVEHSDPHHDAARSYLSGRDHERALAMARRAVDASPAGSSEHGRNGVLVGEILLADRQAEAARLQFERVVADTDPADLRVYVEIADACFDHSVPEAAFIWLDRGLDRALKLGVGALSSEQRATITLLVDLRADALPWNAEDHRGDHARRLLERNLATQPFAATPIWQRNVMRATNAAEQPGRNDPCPCGSGSKFKRCCLE